MFFYFFLDVAGEFDLRVYACCEQQGPHFACWANLMPSAR